MMVAGKALLKDPLLDLLLARQKVGQWDPTRDQK